MADEYLTKKEFDSYKEDISNQIKNIHASSDLKMARIDQSLKRIEDLLRTEIENMQKNLDIQTSGNRKMLAYLGASLTGFGGFVYGLYQYLDGRINEILSLEISSRLNTVEGQVREALCFTHAIHC